METNEIARSGPEFDEQLGVAAVSAVHLCDLLPALRANPTDDALWAQADTLLGELAMGLDELAKTVVDHSKELTRLKAHLKLK